MAAKDAAAQLDAILAPLARWRQAQGTEDICINKPHEAFIRQSGQWHHIETPLDYDDLYDIAILAGSLTKQNVSERKPLLGTDLPTGERLQAVLYPCVPSGTASLTLRVPSVRVPEIGSLPGRYRLNRWNRWEDRRTARARDYAALLAFYDKGDIVGFFEEAVRLSMNMVLCGKTGAGKSTFMKTLVSIVDPHARIITIENAREIPIINQPNHVNMLYSHGDQSVAQVTQRHLLEALLRMRPDFAVIGEIRDADACYTHVNEVMTGHEGSPTTVHGRTASQAFTRLFNLFKASPEGQSYSEEMVIRQLGLAVDMIVPFHEQGGVYEIGEVWYQADAERRGATIAELLER